MHKPKSACCYIGEPVPSLHHEPWTLIDEDLLTSWAGDGQGLREIAIALRRTEQAVVTKYRRLTGEEFVVSPSFSVPRLEEPTPSVNIFPRVNLILPSKPAGEGAINIDAERLCDVDGKLRCFVEEREDGLLKDKSFYLPGRYEWVIVRDEYGKLCLVPLKKL